MSERMTWPAVFKCKDTCKILLQFIITTQFTEDIAIETGSRTISLTETITTLSPVNHVPDCLSSWCFPILYRFPQLLLGVGGITTQETNKQTNKQKHTHPELKLSSF